MSVTRNAARAIRAWVEAWPAEPSAAALHRVWRYLGQWRSVMLANTHIQHEGPRIYAGPFRGMTYLDTSAEGALMPRLLGTYESELHPHIESFAGEGIEVVIDVGCAEGFYAVGLARRMPQASVYAYDIDPAARRACAALAEKNGVVDRVIVGEEFRPHDFAAFAGRRVLVVVDAEGAELDILRPDLAPALASMNLIVETHDVHRPGALAAMIQRFSPTHDIIRVDQQAKVFDMPLWMRGLTQLDQLIAVWEWRVEPTPWLVMRPKT